MQVQIRHVPFNLDTVNQEPQIYLENNRPGPVIDKPDQFWILNNMTGNEYYSVGKFEKGPIPSTINGIPTNVQGRGGQWTYHGPGQVSFVVIFNVKRLARAWREPDRARLLVGIFKQCIEELYGVKLEYNEADPGLYFLDGSKVGSFGNDCPAFSWVGVKLSLNLNVDLDKFKQIDTCGVSNRAMANLFPQQTITAEQTSVIGETIARAVIEKLYDGKAEISSWTAT